MGSQGIHGDPMFGVIGILLLLAWIANNALGLDPRVPQWALWIFAGGCLGFDFIRSQFRPGNPQMALATTPPVAVKSLSGRI
jgi:uncharacterized membrane protein YdcZ (DUF606 family)